MYSNFFKEPGALCLSEGVSHSALRGSVSFGDESPIVIIGGGTDMSGHGYQGATSTSIRLARYATGGGGGRGAWFIIHIGIGGDIRTARSPIVPTVIRRCDKIRMIVCWVATNVSVSTLLKRNIKLARQHSYYHNQWSPTHPAHASGAVEPHCN